LVDHTGSSFGAAIASHRPSRFWNERCLKLPGIYSGCMVEPHPLGGLAADGSDGSVFESLGRIRIIPDSGNPPRADTAASVMHRVFPHSGHRQPTQRYYHREPTESG